MMFTIAHYWGIDEIGVFVVPAVLAIIALRWVEKRSRRNAESNESEVPTVDSTEEAVDVD